MNKRKDLLSLISERLYQKGNSYNTAIKLSDEGLRLMLQTMQQYYELNDFETTNIHSDIFTTLYMDKKKLSYDEIAEKYHIHIYTLDRYRQRYNKLAEKLLEKAIKNN